MQRLIPNGTSSFAWWLGNRIIHWMWICACCPCYAHTHPQQQPPCSIYLALFTLHPPTNLSSWKGASHSLWSKQSLAHLSSLCYNNSLHPQNWETSLQHNHLCCLLITTTAYKRRDGNRCVTHTITATLQIQPYCSYRGLVVALSPTPAAAAGLLLATEKNPQTVF